MRTPKLTGQGADRAYASVQVQLLSEADVDGSEAFADGGGARSFERDAVFTDQVERGVGEWVAEVLGGAEAGERLDPLNLGAGGADHGLHGRRYLRADAVARDQYDRSGQGLLR